MSDKLDRYEADARCLNCGFEGTVQPVVGKPVCRTACPVCQCTFLRAPLVEEENRARRGVPDAE